MKELELICRKACESDDAMRIAKYLHLTDPYIYPCLCQDPCDPDWVSMIRHCLTDKNDLYQLNHLSVALDRDTVIGVVCVFPSGVPLHFAQGFVCPDRMRVGLSLAMQGYFDPLFQETIEGDGYNLTNICIDADYRGCGVGGALLGHCVELYGHDTIRLDVIADNAPAIALYQKHGFVIERAYNGFSGTDILLPCYHMVRVGK